MHALRRSVRTARLVLAWFALALLVALASPLVQAPAMELVCSAGAGVKLVVLGEDGQALPADGHTLDCPACLGLASPPPRGDARAAVPQARAAAWRAVPVRAARAAAAPLPARGPPARA